MQRYLATVRTEFHVEVDETKFTPEFFAEFSSFMWHMDTVEEAVEHLADLFARGLIRGDADEFIEGYGPAKDMGIRFIVERDVPNPVSADLRVDVDIELVSADALAA